MDKIAKAIVGAVMAGLAAYAAAVTDGNVSAEEWATIGIAFLGALGLVWGVPNAPSGQTVSETHTYTATEPPA